MLTNSQINQANKLQAMNMVKHDQDYVIVGDDMVMVNERDGTVFMYAHNGECDMDKFTKLYQVI